MPTIYQYNQIESCLDTGFALYHESKLEIWDSVIAESQSAGRGQMRRKWLSPPGNLYVALRLPQCAPFLGSEAASALGAALCAILRPMGWPVLLKWPNDIITFIADEPRKLGGILLEERGNALLAGIGLNIQSCPNHSSLRENTAHAACCVKDFWPCAMALPHAKLLWQILADKIYALYYAKPPLAKTWQKFANRCLLWRNEPIDIDDGQYSFCGKLLGIGKNGELLLETAQGIKSFFSGSLRAIASG